MQTDDEVIAGWVRTRYPEPRSIRERVAAARTRGATVSGLTSLVIVVGLQLLAPGGTRRRPWTTGHMHWLTTLAIVLVILGAVTVVGFIVWAWASGRARAERQAPLLALTLRQRRQVRRQALGRQSCLPEDVSFLRLLAGRWTSPDHVTGMAAGALPLFSGLAIRQWQRSRYGP